MAHVDNNTHTQAIRLGFLIENFFVKLTFSSFVGISIQILILLLAFPSTELGAPVLIVSRHKTKFRNQNYQSNQ